MLVLGAHVGYESRSKICTPRVDTQARVVSIVKRVSPVPAFTMSVVFIPLAACTMALGAVDTGSMNARLAVRVAGSIKKRGLS